GGVVARVAHGVGRIFGVRLHRVGGVVDSRFRLVGGVVVVRLDIVGGLLGRALVARCERAEGEGNRENGGGLHELSPFVVSIGRAGARPGVQYAQTLFSVPRLQQFTPAGRSRDGPLGALRTAQNKEFSWVTSPSSAPNGATKARARSSIGWPAAPTWSSASRAVTTPATRSSAATRPISCRSSRAGSYAARRRSSAMASSSIRGR